MDSRGPDVVIRGPWIDGKIEVDGMPLDWPIVALSWSMAGLPENGDAFPTLTIKVECSRIRIDHGWPGVDAAAEPTLGEV